MGLNEWRVIQHNSNQRYVTMESIVVNGIYQLIMRGLVHGAKLPPVQEFMVRNNCRYGSTIGPVLSVIDVGCTQLSMHSIRETMKVKDRTHGLTLFRAFFTMTLRRLMASANHK